MQSINYRCCDQCGKEVIDKFVRQVTAYGLMYFCDNICEKHYNTEFERIDDETGNN